MWQKSSNDNADSPVTEYMQLTSYKKSQLMLPIILDAFLISTAIWSLLLLVLLSVLGAKVWERTSSLY